MTPITLLHVAAGALALACGPVAFAVHKGGTAHVRAGTAFCVAMFVLGVTASFLAPLKTPPESPVGGLFVCYFVATAWMAARRRDGAPGRFEQIACALILALTAAIFWRAAELAQAPVPTPTPPGPVGLAILGSLCALAGAGDLRYLLRGSLTPTQRLSRHLWRMCFAFFIATGSFFLGQQDVLPAAWRGSPWLLLPAFAPFGLMLFWLLRVARRGRRVASRANAAR